MRKGFTLIELIVVVAIIGLLATIFIIPVQSSRKKCIESGNCKTSNVVNDALKSITNDLDECMKLSNTPQKDLPAKCLKYYTK